MSNSHEILIETKSGLPNPSFRNQGFFVKKQELIRRFFLKNQEKNQETFSGNQNKNTTVSRTFFRKSKAFHPQMFIVLIFGRKK
jgi:hypothetical protein